MQHTSYFKRTVLCI